MFERWLAGRLGQVLGKTRGYSSEDMAGYIGEYLQETDGLDFND
jgi:hypothetical protein